MSGKDVLRDQVTSRTGRLPLACLAVLMAASLLLAIGAEGSAAAGLKVRMTPKVAVPIAKRTCFKGDVRGKAGNPVKGAIVNLDGKTTKTRKRGKFRFCTIVKWPGRHAAQAQKGKKTGFAFFKAKSFGTGLGGKWIRQEMQLPAYSLTYGDNRGCHRNDFLSSQPDFAEIGGYCVGPANQFTDGMFSGNRSQVKWETTDVGNRVPVVLDASIPDHTRQLVGYMNSEAERVLYVTSGANDSGPLQGGTDPGKAGQQGGPGLFNITLHRDGLTQIADGYTFHFIGWVFQQNS